MDFAPMNIRMAVPQSNEVAEMQNNLNQYGNVLHNYRTNKNKEDQKLKQQQVRKKEEAEGQKIKDDPDRQKKQGKYGLSKRDRKLIESLEEEKIQDDEPEPMAFDQYRGRNLDISG